MNKKYIIDNEIQFVQAEESEDGSEGIVTIRAATFEKPNAKGWILTSGMFGSKDNKVYVSDWNHSSKRGGLFSMPAKPVAYGMLKQEGNELLGEIHYSLSYEPSKQSYEYVKYMKSLVQWSIGFSAMNKDVVEEGKYLRIKKGRLEEVSPVDFGADKTNRTIKVQAEDLEEIETSEILTILSERDGKEYGDIMPYKKFLTDNFINTHNEVE